MHDQRLPRSIFPISTTLFHMYMCFASLEHSIFSRFSFSFGYCVCTRRTRLSDAFSSIFIYPFALRLPFLRHKSRNVCRWRRFVRFQKLNSVEPKKNTHTYSYTPLASRKNEQSLRSEQDEPTNCSRSEKSERKSSEWQGKKPVHTIPSCTECLIHFNVQYKIMFDYISDIFTRLVHEMHAQHCVSIFLSTSSVTAFFSTRKFRYMRVERGLHFHLSLYSDGCNGSPKILAMVGSTSTQNMPLVLLIHSLTHLHIECWAERSWGN